MRNFQLSSPEAVRCPGPSQIISMAFWVGAMSTDQTMFLFVATVRLTVGHLVHQLLKLSAADTKSGVLVSSCLRAAGHGCRGPHPTAALERLSRPLGRAPYTVSENWVESRLSQWNEGPDLPACAHPACEVLSLSMNVSRHARYWKMVLSTNSGALSTRPSNAHQNLTSPKPTRLRCRSVS